MSIEMMLIIGAGVLAILYGLWAIKAFYLQALVMKECRKLRQLFSLARVPI